MKKLVLLLLGAFVIIMAGYLRFTIEGKAEEAKFSISIPDKKVVKGEEFTIEMSVKGSTSFLYADAYLSYNSDKAELVQDDETIITGGGGVIHIAETFATSVKEQVYQIKMMALETGKVEFSIMDAFIEISENFQVKDLTPVTAVVDIGVNNKESDETRLAELDIYPGELTPAFEPDTNNYYVTVSKLTDSLIISAVPMDSNAIVSVDGNEDFAKGTNEVVITVSSLSGMIKQYKINVQK